MRFGNLVAAVAAVLNFGPLPASAEFTYTPLKEVDTRAWEGNQLSQWLRGEFRDPYTGMLVIFPAGEAVEFCESIVFERNEKYSFEGAHETLEADFGDYRSMGFSLRGRRGGESYANLTMPSPQGIVTIRFSEPVHEIAPSGEYFKAEATQICVSPLGEGYCNPAREDTAPLYVVGLKSGFEDRREYLCSYFMFLNSKS